MKVSIEKNPKSKQARHKNKGDIHFSTTKSCLKYLTTLIDCSQKASNKASLREAENKLTELAQCKRFSATMITLSIGNQATQQQKLLALASIGHYANGLLEEQIPQFLQACLHAFSCPVNTIKYKNNLVHTLKKITQKTDIRKNVFDIVTSIVQEGKFLSMGFEDVVIFLGIFLAQMCAYKPQFSNYRVTAFPLYLSLAKSLLEDEENPLLPYLLRLLSLLIERSLYEGADKFYVLVSEQMSHLIEGCLKKNRSGIFNHGITIITTILKIIKPKIKIFAKQPLLRALPSFILESVQSLVESNELNFEGRKKIQYILHFISISAKSGLCQKEIDQVRDQILNACARVFNLQEQDKQSYYYRAQEFIGMLQNIYYPNRTEILQKISLKEWEKIHPDEDDEDCEIPEARIMASIILQDTCKNHDGMAPYIFNKILEGLRNESKIGISWTTAFIFIGSLHNEVAKRPEIEQKILVLFVDNLKERSIPTKSSIQSEKFQYILMFYMGFVFFETALIESSILANIVFSYASKILITQDVQDSLLLLALHIVEKFSLHLRRNLNIFNKLQNLFQRGNSQEITAQILRIYGGHLKCLQKSDYDELTNEVVADGLQMLKICMAGSNIVSSAIAILCVWPRKMNQVKGYQEMDLRVYVANSLQIAILQKNQDSQQILTSVLEMLIHKNHFFSYYCEEEIRLAKCIIPKIFQITQSFGKVYQLFLNILSNCEEREILEIILTFNLQISGLMGKDSQNCLGLFIIQKLMLEFTDFFNQDILMNIWEKLMNKVKQIHYYNDESYSTNLLALQFLVYVLLFRSHSDDKMIQNAKLLTQVFWGQKWAAKVMLFSLSRLIENAENYHILLALALDILQGLLPQKIKHVGKNINKYQTEQENVLRLKQQQLIASCNLNQQQHMQNAVFKLQESHPEWRWQDDLTRTQQETLRNLLKSQRVDSGLRIIHQLRWR